jgi:ABC-type transport system substrate-binding protein
MNYAVDKDAIVKNVLFGAGQVSSAPVIPSAFGYCKVGPYPYDPDKAKQLLQQAGAANMEITMVTPNGRFLQDQQTAQAIAGYLKDVGIKVNGPLTQDNASNQAIVSAPPATSNGNPQAEVSIWSFAADFADASQPIGRLYTSTSIPPQPGINYAHYGNPQVDQLNLTGATESDQTKASDAYCQAEKQIWNDAPQIFLWTSGFIVVSSKKVAGVSTAPVNGIFNTIYAYPAS